MIIPFGLRQSYQDSMGTSLSNLFSVFSFPNWKYVKLPQMIWDFSSVLVSYGSALHSYLHEFILGCMKYKELILLQIYWIMSKTWKKMWGSTFCVRFKGKKHTSSSSFCSSMHFLSLSMQFSHNWLQWNV